MADKNYFDFSGGLDAYNSKPLVGQSEKKCYLTGCQNIELLNNKGLKRMAGSVLKKDVGSKILGMKEFELNGNRELIVNAADGKCYRLDANNALNELKTGLSLTAKCNYAEFIKDYGVIVSNGVDDLFYVFNNGVDHADNCNATTSGGHNIRSRAIEVYKNYIFVVDGSTLYYSARGIFNDWTTVNDSGSINNFHSDNSPGTALKSYKSYLAIHKEKQTYFLSGDDPESFSIIPFADKGSLSPFGVSTVDNTQYFYNNGFYTFAQVGDNNQIRLQDDIAKIIRNDLQDLNAGKINENMILHYKNKNQLWWFVANNTDDYFNTIFIYDYDNKCWFKRVVPYNVTYACEYDGYVLTGTDTGLILKEGFGKTFNGLDMGALWFVNLPYLHFGQPNKKKTIDEPYIIFDAGADNKFTLKLRKDYNDYEIDEEDRITLTNGEDLVWDDNSDNATVWDDNSWSQEGNIEYERINISGSNRSVQPIFAGTEDGDDLNIIGLELRDILIDE